MSKLSILASKALRTIKSNSPMLLSLTAAAGVGCTAYLAGRASWKAALTLDHEFVKRFNDGENSINEAVLTNKEKVQLVWKLYIPATVSGIVTISCIAAAGQTQLKKTIAATTALSFTERAYSEYRDKVIEEYGERKDEAIRSKIAADRLVERPPPSNDILVTGPGMVLCCELFTGRYFVSDMEKLRRAQNDINAKILSHDEATLDDFYYIIGINRTSYSGNIGWTSTRQMELQFSPLLTEDGRPCLAFDYNYTKPL
jgi:hypothetical protein